MKSKLIPLIGVLAIAAAVGLGAFTMARSQGWNASGMMGAFNPGGVMGSAGPGSGNPISIDRAVGIAQQTAAGYSNRTLVVDEVIEFQNNFYASMKEQDTGVGAFEVLINRYSGAVSPEIGPNMMWNTAYGITGQGGMGQGGMMGAITRSNGTMTVSKEKATGVAQSWLDGHLAGNVTRAPDTFHGYYTIDFEKGGKLVGMLSVNGYSGQVWPHTWHGGYVQTKDLGK